MGRRCRTRPSAADHRDVDSTICEVHDHHKGAAYGDTRQLGYHPLLASRADTGEVLHLRMRNGSANTARRRGEHCVGLWALEPCTHRVCGLQALAM